MHDTFRGILTGAAIGAVFWSAIGLYFIYDFQPVHIDTRPDRYSWTCITDMECELEAQRKGLPIDRD